jgi:hypothetical protein
LDQLVTEKPLYNTTIEQYRISVVVLCAVLAEYSINFYLSAKCEAAKFAELEGRSLFKKWTELPKQFLPAYKLPPNSELAGDLLRLIDRRNSIVHPNDFTRTYTALERRRETKNTFSSVH